MRKDSSRDREIGLYKRLIALWLGLNSSKWSTLIVGIGLLFCRRGRIRYPLQYRTLYRAVIFTVPFTL
jgi:hypothetical protein